MMGLNTSSLLLLLVTLILALAAYTMDVNPYAKFVPIYTTRIEAMGNYDVACVACSPQTDPRFVQTFPPWFPFLRY